MAFVATAGAVRRREHYLFLGQAFAPAQTPSGRSRVKTARDNFRALWQARADRCRPPFRRLQRSPGRKAAFEMAAKNDGARHLQFASSALDDIGVMDSRRTSTIVRLAGPDLSLRLTPMSTRLTQSSERAATVADVRGSMACRHQYRGPVFCFASRRALRTHAWPGSDTAGRRREKNRSCCLARQEGRTMLLPSSRARTRWR